MKKERIVNAQPFTGLCQTAVVHKNLYSRLLCVVRRDAAHKQYEFLNYVLSIHHIDKNNSLSKPSPQPLASSRKMNHLKKRYWVVFVCQESHCRVSVDYRTPSLALAPHLTFLFLLIPVCPVWFTAHSHDLLIQSCSTFWVMSVIVWNEASNL